MARALAGTAAVVAAAVLAGCGVPVSDTAEPVKDYQPPPTAPPSASSTAGANEVSLWFVNGDHLERARTAAPVPVTPTELLTLLAEPPASGDLQTLVGDPQGGAPLASVEPTPATPVPAGTVVVALSDTFLRLAPPQQMLLIGQVVLTLTDAGATSVVFNDVHGASVTVPLPDGRLVEAPVTRADYLTLTSAAPSSP